MNELNYTQQFELRRMRDAAQEMSREQALVLLMQAQRLLMIKTNVLRDLISRSTIELKE